MKSLLIFCIALSILFAIFSVPSVDAQSSQQCLETESINDFLSIADPDNWLENNGTNSVSNSQLEEIWYSLEDTLGRVRHNISITIWLADRSVLRERVRYWELWRQAGSAGFFRWDSDCMLNLIPKDQRPLPVDAQAMILVNTEYRSDLVFAALGHEFVEWLSSGHTEDYRSDGCPEYLGDVHDPLTWYCVTREDEGIEEIFQVAFKYEECGSLMRVFPPHIREQRGYIFSNYLDLPQMQGCNGIVEALNS